MNNNSAYQYQLGAAYIVPLSTVWEYIDYIIGTEVNLQYSDI